MITIKELDTIRSGISRQSQSIYVGQIRKHWCPFAGGQGKCTKVCHANAFCRPVILRATDLSNARVPVALLIYKLRQEREKAEMTAARTAETPRLAKKDMVADACAALAQELGL